MDEQPDRTSDDVPMTAVTGEITGDAMPSLGDQMDEAGRGLTGMRMSLATASDSETGEEVGELLVGMAGYLWYEDADGPRVRFRTDELVAAARSLIADSEYAPPEWGDDE